MLLAIAISIAVTAALILRTDSNPAGQINSISDDAIAPARPALFLQSGGEPLPGVRYSVRAIARDGSQIDQLGKLQGDAAFGSTEESTPWYSGTLPYAAFALEESDQLDPRVPAGPFEAFLYVDAAPPDSAAARSRGARFISGRPGFAIQNLSATVIHAGVPVHADAAGLDRVVTSVTAEPVSLAIQTPSIIYRVIRRQPGPVRFEAMWKGERNFGEPTLWKAPGLPIEPRAFTRLESEMGTQAWSTPIHSLPDLLASSRCTACHAFGVNRPLVSGENSRNAPDLPSILPDFADDSRAWYATHPMSDNDPVAAPPTMSDAEIDALLHGLRATTPRPR